VNSPSNRPVSLVGCPEVGAGRVENVRIQRRFYGSNYAQKAEVVL